MNKCQIIQFRLFYSNMPSAFEDYAFKEIFWGFSSSRTNYIY
jgi:hypothetical protein